MSSTTHGIARRPALIVGVSLLLMAVLAGAAVSLGRTVPALACWLGVVVLDLVAGVGLWRAFRPSGPAVLAAGLLRIVYGLVFLVLLAPIVSSYVAGTDPEQGWEAYTDRWPWALAVFGLHLIVLALVLRDRGRGPMVIALLLALAGVAYVIAPVVGDVSAGEAAKSVVEGVQAVAGALGEIALAVWLLVVAVRTRQASG
ncbi:MAG: DUF4386 family protein [Actinomycetia bacterium]|nr:DUF4386 family protein [Actinomycetes bacterium]